MTTSTVSVKKVNPVLIVAILLALAGIGVWVYQLIVGMQATGLSQQVVWGLYISAFFTAVGAGAALLALTGVSEFVPLFQATNRARNMCLALSSFIIGALLIVLDVGNPLNIWRVMTAFQLSSWMTWDFWLLVIAGVVALVYLLSAQNNRAQKVLGILGILAGIAVVVVEGWMLSSQAARPMWGSGMTVASFLLGAAIAGLSIALIAGLGGEFVPFWLKVALGLSLVLVLVEVLSSLVGSGRGSRFDPDRIYLTCFLAASDRRPDCAHRAFGAQEVWLVGGHPGVIRSADRESMGVGCRDIDPLDARSAGNLFPESG